MRERERERDLTKSKIDSRDAKNRPCFCLSLEVDILFYETRFCRRGSTLLYLFMNEDKKNSKQNGRVQKTNMHSISTPNKLTS